MKIKDIGKRQFESGAQRDSEEGKENYIESISWLALRRYSFYMKSCEKRYGKGNYKKGIPTDSYERSLMRHLQKYLANKYEGANLEPEVDHLSAAFFNLSGILANEEKEKLKSNDKR